tara:strand:- start:5952 stop:7187 length:1236 start_codon:yes stop_codon:yes gene_type:complete
MKLRSVRGTHDLFGDEINKFNNIYQIVSKVAHLNKFLEIETPIFEFTELFSKPLGEMSDVVLKEMYTFKDRNEDQLTLRPEYTTPMIRAAISNNLLNELPLKLYGLGPVFRRERPQKGRYRQFNQINFEIFGSNDSIADLEIISIANKILKSLIPESNFTLNINSLGRRENLVKYKKDLSKYFNDKKMQLSEESIFKIDSNPLRILDSKQQNDIEISNNAPPITEYLSNNAKVKFEELKQGLTSNKISYIENLKLVRGLDYYCDTVFEFKTQDLGSQDTILGGGRYDGLISKLGGPDIPGIGWAAGIERISMLMKKIKINEKHVHIAINDESFKSHLIKIIKYFNDNEIIFFWNYKYNLKKSLSRANSNNANYVIIIGEKEYKKNFYTIKNLITGEQSELSIDKIKKFLND